MAIWQRSDRRMAPAPVLSIRCAHCHREIGARLRVIPGVGLRNLCGACETRLNEMGFGVFEDRRRHG